MIYQNTKTKHPKLHKIWDITLAHIFLFFLGVGLPLDDGDGAGLVAAAPNGFAIEKMLWIKIEKKVPVFCLK